MVCFSCSLYNKIFESAAAYVHFLLEVKEEERERGFIYIEEMLMESNEREKGSGMEGQEGK